MRYPLATDLKTRTGAPDKDARLKNAYVEARGDQSVVRKRPVAQGGVSVGSGVAQGGIGLNVGGTDYIYTVNGDTAALDTLATAGTDWVSGTAYSVGDHVSVGFVDYWALTDNSNSDPSSNPSDWSSSYVPAVPRTYATWDSATKIGFTLSNGDLTATATAVSTSFVQSTIPIANGKWFYENTRDNAFSYCYILVGNGGDESIAYNSNTGEITNWVGDTIAADSYTSGDVIGVAAYLQSDTSLSVTFYKNGVSQGTLTRTLTAGEPYAQVFTFSNSAPDLFACTANFGASAFAYSVPSGYNSGLYT